MLGLMALTFVAGCIVGAALNDLARWQRQRGAAQNLHGLTTEQEPTDQT